FFECLINATHNISPAVLFSDAEPENIRKNLRSKLGGNFDEFYKEFLHTCNSTFEEDFFR
ncbi:24622_t:CDS:2, partial [Cetraspora pellucida]